MIGGDTLVFDVVVGVDERFRLYFTVVAGAHNLHLQRQLHAGIANLVRWIVLKWVVVVGAAYLVARIEAVLIVVGGWRASKLG